MLSLAKSLFEEPLPTRILGFTQMNVEQGRGDNGRFRIGKQSVYEGGVRALGFVVWPGHIPATKRSDRITVADILPTLLDAGGIEVAGNRVRD